MEHRRNWYRDMVLYQIYPRSFKDGNGDGIGDFKGMIEKLDYLADLGITAVWLSPVFASPNVDNGYDISDYRDIMQEFGTLDDWKVLRDGLHERGIAIIMDLVLNHTSDQHVWFQESKKSRDNKYSDYYIWADPNPDGSAPNDWEAVFGGSAWEYVPERGQYYLHSFAVQQPDLNWDHPAARDEIFDIIRYWNDMGVDGYRVDAISFLDKGLDGRADFSAGTAVDGCTNLSGTHKHIQDMVRETIAPDHLFTVGEIFVRNPEDLWNYTADERGEFAMGIAFVPPIVEINTWSPEKMKRDVKETYELMNGNGWWMRFFSNHDKPRQVSLYGDDKKYWKESAKLLACYLHTLPGTPIIYQGEEIGMTNISLPSIADYDDIQTHNNYQEAKKQGMNDSDALAYAVRLSRDNARTPMQWDDSAFAGFTTGDGTWLRVNPNFTDINVSSQEDDPDSILNFYRTLTALRKKYPIVAHGSYEDIAKADGKILAYKRTLGEDTWIVIHNFQGKETSFEALDIMKEETEILLSNYGRCGFSEEELKTGSIRLRPYETMIITCSRQ